MKNNELTRRQAMLQGLFGAGMVGLRSLATGLPIPFLLNPRRAMAEVERPAQYLILSTSAAGDPLNCNCPGMYDLPSNFPSDAIVHPNNDAMAPTPLYLSGKKYTAAAPWASLPQDVLNRTAFVHHQTLTANHGEQNRVMMLMGSVRRGEMSTSLFSKNLSSVLHTVQAQPLALSSEVTAFEGQYQPTFRPTGIKAMLSAPNNPLSQLQARRDSDLDALYTMFKDSRKTRAQRDFIDKMATSRQQLRALSDQFANDIASINGDDSNNQALVAAILIRMNVAPMYTIHIPFGGDNHFDKGFAQETAQHVAGLKTINALLAKLTAYELQDKVTFAAMNVFGRTFKDDIEGRGHNSIHHVTVMIGANIKGGVIGGPTPKGGSLSIDPATGVGSDQAPLDPLDGLASVGKTLGAAVGVDPAVIDEQITSRTIISAALR